jgi:hypothetical protein
LCKLHLKKFRAPKLIKGPPENQGSSGILLQL